MRIARSAALLLTGIAAVTLAGCAPRETAEQRVSRIRLDYEIRPTGFQPITLADGRSGLVVDMLILDKGKERLDHLTVLVRVVGPDGKARVTEPATLDTSDVLPGVTSQVSATVPGVELHEGESVTVELENLPDAAARSRYREYRDALSSGG